MNLLINQTIHIVSGGFAAIGMEMYVLIFVLIIVLVGGKKIPELMRGVGKGVGELQKGLEEGKKGLNTTSYEEPVKPVAAPVAQTPAEAEPRPETPKV